MVPDQTRDTCASTNTPPVLGLSSAVDIDGEAAGDKFGVSVSMNSAGNRVAIGAYLNDGTASDAGHVRVYEYASGSWSQVQSDIDGEATSDILVSVSHYLGSGDRVAIGGYLNDGTASNAGHVRIYDLKPGALHYDHLSANSSGTAVADGATTNDATLTLTLPQAQQPPILQQQTSPYQGGVIIILLLPAPPFIPQRFTPSAAGATTIDVAAGKFTDAQDNNNLAATQFNWTYDNVAPTMTITATDGGTAVAHGATTNDATLTVTFTSSEATTNCVAGDITLSGGAIILIFLPLVLPFIPQPLRHSAGATTIDCLLPNTFTDAAGNNNTAATQFN